MERYLEEKISDRRRPNTESCSTFEMLYYQNKPVHPTSVNNADKQMYNQRAIECYKNSCSLKAVTVEPRYKEVGYNKTLL